MISVAVFYNEVNGCFSASVWRKTGAMQVHNKQYLKISSQSARRMYKLLMMREFSFRPFRGAVGWVMAKDV